MSEKVFMQKGVAVWLVKHTKLSNQQIANFCSLHPMEVNHYRSSSNHSIIECNPINSLLLTIEEIEKCEKNSALDLAKITQIQQSVKRSRATAKKSEVVNAILWLIQNHPEMSVGEIVKLLNCTGSLVKSIKDKSYKDLDEVVPKHPVMLGLCSQETLDKAVMLE